MANTHFDKAAFDLLWLEEKLGYKPLDHYSFIERVAIKIESGTDQETARNEAFNEHFRCAKQA